jgi:hypothetical protein
MRQHKKRQAKNLYLHTFSSCSPISLSNSMEIESLIGNRMIINNANTVQRIFILVLLRCLKFLKSGKLLSKSQSRFEGCWIQNSPSGQSALKSGHGFWIHFIKFLSKQHWDADSLQFVPFETDASNRALNSSLKNVSLSKAGSSCLAGSGTLCATSTEWSNGVYAASPSSEQAQYVEPPGKSDCA